MKSKSTIRSILTHHRQNPTEIIRFEAKDYGQNLRIHVNFPDFG